MMEIAGETKMERRWRKMPQEKPQEWMEKMIMGTYKLHKGVDKMEQDCKFMNEFWPSTPKMGNDGHKLSDLTTKDGDRMVVVVKFKNPIFTLNQPFQVCIGVATTIIKSYLGQRTINWRKLLKDMIMKISNNIYRDQGCQMTPYAMHIYHHLNLLMEEEITTYNDTS